MPDAPRKARNDGSDPVHRRSVRSYVLRGGRLTDGQRRALEELWPRFGVPEGAGQLDFRQLYGNARPVIMEIGFGDGDATWRMALDHPEENYLGVEVHAPGVGRLMIQLARRKVENVRIARQDAAALLEQRVPDASLAGVRIYFPDPWPKKRHHKRRLIQPEFARLLAARMRTGAILHMVTDWEPYARHMLETMKDVRAFQNRSPSGDFCSKPPWRPVTKYEKRGERLGHHVFDLLFERTDH